MKGKVYLVGAGPGDPDLITVKGKRLLEEAHIVIYDRLVGDEVLGYIRPEAEMIFVGKKDFRHTVPQEEINALIVKKASEGDLIAISGIGENTAPVILEDAQDFTDD